MKLNENEMNFSVPLEIIKASEIEPKEVKWLWYPYIPFGKVTLLQGDPGDGKSKLMLSIAALLSKGEPIPFTETEENEPMTIIYQTTEDDADDTVVPRFNSAGGDGENLIFIKEDEKTLSFGDNRIREAIEKYNAKLLILDPLSSYIGENCSMNNANETRAEFNHLIAVAKDTGCAIVIIAHMNKMKDNRQGHHGAPLRPAPRQETCAQLWRGLFPGEHPQADSGPEPPPAGTNAGAKTVQAPRRLETGQKGDGVPRPLLPLLLSAGGVPQKAEPPDGPCAPRAAGGFNPGRGTYRRGAAAFPPPH